MLLILGKNTRLLEVYEDEDSVCENCNECSINYTVSQTYFHFFWIPVFPLLKIVGIYCSHCHHTINEVFSQKGAQYEKKTVTPLNMFTWLIVIAVILAIGILSSSN
jgi:hypothetical protein